MLAFHPAEHGLQNNQQVPAIGTAEEEVRRQVPVQEGELMLAEEEEEDDEEEQQQQGRVPAHHDTITGQPLHLLAFVQQQGPQLEEDGMQMDAVEDVQGPTVVAIETEAPISSPPSARTGPIEKEDILVQEPVVPAITAAIPLVEFRGSWLCSTRVDDQLYYKHRQEIRK